MKDTFYLILSAFRLVDRTLLLVVHIAWQPVLNKLNIANVSHIECLAKQEY
jgi:hypothetical protein